MSNVKNAPKTAGTIADLTDAQRKTLAASIVKARSNGQSWDGEAGICNDGRFPLIKSAGQGRKLIREVGKAEMIAKSYVAMKDGSPRKGYVRTADPKPAAKKTAAKKTVAKPAAKRTRKPAAK